MGLILNIETSTTICSVCIANDGTAIDFREDRTGNSHARVLTVFIDELLKANKIELHRLTAVAVSAGPGSYTGLRIGTSVAKGLCYALNIPLIAVPTLHALAEGIKKKVGKNNITTLPVIDARRMDVYTAVVEANGNELLATSCLTVNQQLLDTLSVFGDIYIGGNALIKCKTILNLPAFHFVDDVECHTLNMVQLSESASIKKQFVDLAYFEPFYLKEFGAHNK